MVRKASFKSFYLEYPKYLFLDLFSLIFFLNGLFFFIKEAELANFADDNTIYVGSNDLAELLEILRKEYKTAINLFKTNNMIVNPNKFQSMIISSKKDLSKSVLKINGVELTMESSVKLHVFFFIRNLARVLVP